MRIDDYLSGVKSVAVFGHIRPDGDCVGSVTGIANYIRDNYPEIEVRSYLETFPKSYYMIPGTELTEKKFYSSGKFDLCILTDVSSLERIGAEGEKCIKNSANSVCFDHHVSNPLNLCRINIVDPDISSACELVLDHMDPEKISYRTACCLYFGMTHDTGVFQFSCTSPDTMRKAAFLMEKGVPFSEIIQNTYFSRNLNQLKVTGAVMNRAETYADGKVICGYLTYEDFAEYKVSSLDMDGIVDALREYEGCDTAVFMYPLRDHYKLSLRSKKIVDVNAVCTVFGGGGHVRAAGCQMKGQPKEILDKVVEEIAKQL